MSSRKPKCLTIHRPVIEEAVRTNGQTFENYVHLPSESIVQYNPETKEFNPDKQYRPEDLIALPVLNASDQFSLFVEEMGVHYPDLPAYDDEVEREDFFKHAESVGWKSVRLDWGNANKLALAFLVNQWKGSLTRTFGATDFHQRPVLPLEIVKLPPFDPPTVIQNEEEYEATQKELAELREKVGDDESHPYYSHLNLLVETIRKYEEQYYPLLHVSAS